MIEDQFVYLDTEIEDALPDISKRLDDQDPFDNPFGQNVENDRVKKDSRPINFVQRQHFLLNVEMGRPGSQPKENFEDQLARSGSFESLLHWIGVPATTQEGESNWEKLRESRPEMIFECMDEEVEILPPVFENSDIEKRSQPPMYRVSVSLSKLLNKIIDQGLPDDSNRLRKEMKVKALFESLNISDTKIYYYLKVPDRESIKLFNEMQSSGENLTTNSFLHKNEIKKRFEEVYESRKITLITAHGWTGTDRGATETVENGKYVNLYGSVMEEAYKFKSAVGDKKNYNFSVLGIGFDGLGFGECQLSDSNKTIGPEQNAVLTGIIRVLNEKDDLDHGKHLQVLAGHSMGGATILYLAQLLGNNGDLFIPEHPAIKIVDATQDLNYWNRAWYELYSQLKEGKTHQTPGIDSIISSTLMTTYHRIVDKAPIIPKVPVLNKATDLVTWLATTMAFIPNTSKSSPDRAEIHLDQIKQKLTSAIRAQQGNALQRGMTSHDFNSLHTLPNLVTIQSQDDNQVSGKITLGLFDDEANALVADKGDHYFSRSSEGVKLTAQVIMLQFLSQESNTGMIDRLNEGKILRWVTDFSRKNDLDLRQIMRIIVPYIENVRKFDWHRFEIGKDYSKVALKQDNPPNEKISEPAAD